MTEESIRPRGYAGAEPDYNLLFSRDAGTRVTTAAADDASINETRLLDVSMMMAGQVVADE